MGRYLDLARRALESSQGSLSYEKNEINEKRVTDPTDPYQGLVRSTLAKVLDQPIGMIPWLRQNRPMLYEKLAVQLPDKIHQLWEGRAPFAEFERILDLWFDAHRASREAYLEASACRRLERE